MKLVGKIMKTNFNFILVLEEPAFLFFSATEFFLTGTIISDFLIPMTVKVNDDSILNYRFSYQSKAG